MKEFSYSIEQNIIFGVGSLKEVPNMLGNYHKKIFIISDKILYKLDVVNKLTGLLDNAGIEYEMFLDIEPNPSVETVNTATESYLQSDASAIVTIGGGSPMDVSKAVGILATFGGKITDYEGYEKVPGEIVPIVAIPTTAGTGSEATKACVITDKERDYKFSIISSKIIPHNAILDPEMIMSLPSSVAASTGIDALVHAVEAYISLKSNPFTDAMAEKAMELIGKYIRRFVANRSDEEAASGMMLASNFAGIAFARALLGNVHAMAHPLGGIFNVPHGVANAILLPEILEYNSLADNGKYKKIYDYIRISKSEVLDFEPKMLVDEINKLTSSLGIPDNLGAVGAKEDKIPQMAADAMKSGNVLVNPRQTTLKDIEFLYKKAFK